MSAAPRVLLECALEHLTLGWVFLFPPNIFQRCGWLARGPERAHVCAHTAHFRPRRCWFCREHASSPPGKRAQAWGQQSPAPWCLTSPCICPVVYFQRRVGCGGEQQDSDHLRGRGVRAGFSGDHRQKHFSIPQFKYEFCFFVSLITSSA